jgi:hypothetical protein
MEGLRLDGLNSTSSDAFSRANEPMCDVRIHRQDEQAMSPLEAVAYFRNRWIAKIERLPGGRMRMILPARTEDDVNMDVLMEGTELTDEQMDQLRGRRIKRITYADNVITGMYLAGRDSTEAGFNLQIRG